MWHTTFYNFFDILTFESKDENQPTRRDYKKTSLSNSFDPSEFESEVVFFLSLFLVEMRAIEIWFLTSKCQKVVCHTAHHPYQECKGA